MGIGGEERREGRKEGRRGIKTFTTLYFTNGRAFLLARRSGGRAKNGVDGNDVVEGIWGTKERKITAQG